MSNAIVPTSQVSARREANAPGHRRSWGPSLSLLVGVAALQCACSLLIRIDDGVDEAISPDASTAREPNQPAAPDGGAGQPLGALDASVVDAAPGVEPADGGPGPAARPVLAFAFIEHPEEGEGSLRLIDVRAALGSVAVGEAPAWRRVLRPSAQAGDVFDFAWSPDGRRIAVRHGTLEGARVALFAAPDWRELPITPAGSPASLPRTTAASNYRWSPDGGALALELASAQGPFIGGYVVGEAGARELPPVALTGPVETLDWLSPSSLFVIQPELAEPELLELRLQGGVFARPEARALLGAFFPIALRRAAAGLIGASTDPTNFVFYWPETADGGFETAFTPSAFLSNRESFAAEPDDVAGTSALFAIGDSSQVLDTLPECPVVLAWVEGPGARSLAGSSIACSSAPGAAAALTVYSYDGAGVRRASRLDDEALLTDLAVASSWEGQARGLAAGGGWLALATVQHDAIVDLRGPSPAYEVRAATAPASTARGFSPSGRFLLGQRGRQLELSVLAPAAGMPPIHLPLPQAAADLAPCDTARHVTSFCGSPRAAERAAARWSASADVASVLAAGEGLVLIAPTEDTVGFASVAVSTCGSGCVTQHEFAE